MKTNPALVAGFFYVMSLREKVESDLQGALQSVIDARGDAEIEAAKKQWQKAYQELERLNAAEALLKEIMKHGNQPES